MKTLFKINVNSDTKNLETIADFAENILKGKKLDQETINEILVSIDEATTNVIKHSYKNKLTGKIKLFVKLQSHKIIISIFDKGAAFNPEKVPPPDLTKNLNKRAIGGLGLYLMQQFMDEVNFFFKGKDGRMENEVRMVKYI